MREQQQQNETTAYTLVDDEKVAELIEDSTEVLDILNSASFIVKHLTHKVLGEVEIIWSFGGEALMKILSPS